jgi:hypothetical protein
MTIGWRSLDQDCVLWQDGYQVRSLSPIEANLLHQAWLTEEWEAMYTAYTHQIQKVAF